MSDEYYSVRLGKANALRADGELPYKGKWDVTHTSQEAKALDDKTGPVRIAGRIMSLREAGKLSFGTIQDGSGKIQIAINAGDQGVDQYKQLLKLLDLGDFIGCEGEMFTTRTGEKTLHAKVTKLLSKTLRPLPEKFHGLADEEKRSRQRYLDILTNEESRKRFEVRHNVVQEIRKMLLENRFIEVETPILQNQASGASARPFVTHHNAMDMALYLRIAPETYLKRLMAGGYDRVFEMGKCFRNEGVDSSHLQEFTMLEWYAAFWDYRDNMRFITTMIRRVTKAALGKLQFEHRGEMIDLEPEWEEITYRDLVLRDTGIDLHKIDTFEQMAAAIKSKNLEIDVTEHVGLGSLIDTLYKRYSRPKLIKPTFVTKHHVDLVPLARKSDENPKELDLFQLLINGQEVVKAYSELVDPVDQRARLEDQAKLAEKGDEEAMALEEDFLEAMEHGMPPMSGLGLGIDRLVTLITNTESIRDVVFFPNVRQKSKNPGKEVTE